MTNSSRPSPGTETMRRNYPLLLKRMERLMEISRQLVSTLDLPKLLHQIVMAATELTDTEVASIMLFDPVSGELRFEAATNLGPSELQGIVVPMEGSIAGWIVSHSAPLVVPDTTKDPRWSHKVDQKTAYITRSILGVPLLTRNKTLGALEALNKRTGSFTLEDVSTLQTLAAQASVAIVNARLFQQSDLVSEMVHELRAPLTSISAASQLLMHPNFPEEKRAPIIRTIQSETERLTQMTTDFLDMARLESGRMRFTIEAFSLPELIAEGLAVIQSQAAARGLQVKQQLPENLPTLESDRVRIKQVLLNLLTNGVKYNRENGTLTISVTLSSDGKTCRVSVADTGKGIPPAAMSRMFEKFYRVPDSERTVAGTGLGLSIAKKMVEVLGGEMGVESTVDVGSTFYFSLPLLFQMPGPLPAP
jgi:signal transduction histidine kinase